MAEANETGRGRSAVNRINKAEAEAEAKAEAKA